MNVDPIEALNIPPDVADHLRPRRPGYDRIAELTVDYSQIALSKKGANLSAEDIAVMFVQPALEALGWNIRRVEQFPFQYSQEAMWPLVTEYRGLQIVVGVRDLRGPFSNERGEDTELMNWAKNVGAEYGLLTNFTTNRIWRFSDESTLSRPLYEVDIRDYLTNPSSELDILGAERFFEVVNVDLHQQSVTLKVDNSYHHVTSDEVTLPPNLGPYGEPDGPRRRAEELMPGLSFGSEVSPRRTITALVRQRESNELFLLLAGGTVPEGTPIIQPAAKHDGTPQDKIGLVDQEIFTETALAAIAQLDGDRPFHSTLPTGYPIAGIAEARPGMRVSKFGGGTGYSQGTVTLIQAAIEITEDFGRTLTLRNGFMVGDQFTGPGDVGAPVLTVDGNEMVGVVVGYTENDTVCLPIQPILDQLNVDLITQPKRFVLRPRPSEEMAALSDSSHGQDRLGFEEYANAFFRLIQDTTPPLTIGIYGAWGSGKSFLMNMIQDRLKPLGNKIMVVKFRAWDYNASEKLWAGLVKQIFSSYEQQFGWYGQIRLSLEPTLKRRLDQLRPRLLPYTLIAIAIGLLVIIFVLLNRDILATLLTGSTAVAFLVELARQLYKIFQTPASQRVVDLFATTDYKDDLDFMEKIKLDLDTLTKNLPKGTKVVVFIDDLDRCDPKKAVEVIEAIKLLLDLDRFIVFMAIDARIITQAIEEHYGKILVEAEITGYEYLDKIVQIPFSIPEPPPAELRGYLGSLVNLEHVPALPPPSPPPEPVTEVVEETLPPPTADEPPQPAPSPDQPSEPAPIEPKPKTKQEADQLPPSLLDEEIAAGEVPFTPAEQDALLDFYAFLDPNPRRLKRLVNVYRLVRTLMAGQEQTGLLNNPSQTLGWLILCEQWPYAAHTMLEILDENLTRIADDRRARRELLYYPLMQLHQAAQTRIAHTDDESLRKLDLKYDRLHNFIDAHLANLTLQDIQTLRPFTVNFNPALSAEVRLTLAHQ